MIQQTASGIVLSELVESLKKHGVSDEIITIAIEEATLESDRQRLQQYRDTGHGIPHEQVAVWLSSIGTDDELPCPR